MQKVVELLDRSPEITACVNDLPRISAAELVSDLVYINYKFNRQISPNISVETFALAFGPGAVELEARYQAERDLPSTDQVPCKECGAIATAQTLDGTNLCDLHWTGKP